MKNILVTGAAGFIGSNFVNWMVNKYSKIYNIIVYDKLTYAGNIHNLDDVKDKITFIQGDICDFGFLKEIFEKYEIDAVVNFAAETHVDNSIKDSFVFIKTNVTGTHTLLEVAREIWGEESPNRFVHISTDEVYGSLGETGYFTESSPIQPSSPYAASKASSDLVAFSYSTTFKMNVTVTNCSNNYGPYQHHEKLIPSMISKILKNEQLPIHGKGLNIRDWIYVEDHCEAIDIILHKGKRGERYNIGGHNEKRNIEIVKIIVEKLGKTDDIITFVKNRKSNDYRYAIDSTKLEKELGWKPRTSLEEGIEKTIKWYIEHPEYLEK